MFLDENNRRCYRSYNSSYRRRNQCRCPKDNSPDRRQCNTDYHQNLFYGTETIYKHIYEIGNCENRSCNDRTNSGY